MDLFELVETSDVRDACDLFKSVYESTNGSDGYVSIEVSPGSANDAHETVAEAQRLWSMVDRPNVMIKVPGTEEGAVAVRQLIGAGMNVNITLLFAIEAHRRVIETNLLGAIHTIAPLVPQAPDRVCEKLVIVHEPASGSRTVSNSPRSDHLLQLAIASSGS